MIDGGRAVGFAQAPWTSGPGLALIDGAAPADLDWTYDRLSAVACEQAGCLRDQGLLPGQLVAVPERPGLGLVLMQHALARVDAALLPVRAAADAPGLEVLLALTGAEWVWQRDMSGRGRLTRLCSGPAQPPALWPSPLALVVETSGSTGAPRAAMLTQANLLAAAALSNRHLGLGAGDCWLCCLPLCHIGGLSITYRCALAGATLLLHSGFDSAAVAADLERRCVTHLSLVPPMLARLLALDRPPPPSLGVVLVGGQALSTALAGQAIAAGWPLHVTYGMTETATQIATSGRLSAPPAPGMVGRPLDSLDVDCSAGADNPRPLRVRGAVVMAGYANPQRLPGVGLTDGWFTTSDLACRGPDGDVCILGRADDVLVTGGVNVHPLRVESLLAGAPGVGAVAVVGLDDPVWGARLVAFYTGAATPTDLDQWCRVHLAGPERPRAFRPLAELPLLESGKLDRGRLRVLARQS
ncbi:AMP-binding protein [uncultured Thiodictyon sp.]|uniref:class I adenylate-forming enzyme family protein n=1 Tax=uncultured Thiodictyon sp. TaxID=1846217 RepID=UPI0025EF73A1|nr:AMP-binding protein [uncultured Thiodictyon sp.]